MSDTPLPTIPLSPAFLRTYTPPQVTGRLTTLAFDAAEEGTFLSEALLLRASHWLLEHPSPYPIRIEFTTDRTIECRWFDGEEEIYAKEFGRKDDA